MVPSLVNYSVNTKLINIVIMQPFNKYIKQVCQTPAPVSVEI